MLREHRSAKISLWSGFQLFWINNQKRDFWIIQECFFFFNSEKSPNGLMTGIDISLRRMPTWATAMWKDTQSSSGNANQAHGEPSHLSGWLLSRQTPPPKTRVGEDGATWGPLLHLGGNAQWCHHCGQNSVCFELSPHGIIQETVCIMAAFLSVLFVATCL